MPCVTGQTKARLQPPDRHREPVHYRFCTLPEPYGYTDHDTFPAILLKADSDRLAHTVVADSGYGSEENYRFMSENGMAGYVKYKLLPHGTTAEIQTGPVQGGKPYYNEEQDFVSVLEGQKMQRIGTRHVKTASGYVSEKCQVQSHQMKAVR